MLINCNTFHYTRSIKCNSQYNVYQVQWGWFSCLSNAIHNYFDMSIKCNTIMMGVYQMQCLQIGCLSNASPHKSVYQKPQQSSICLSKATVDSWMSINCNRILSIKCNTLKMMSIKCNTLISINRTTLNSIKCNLPYVQCKAAQTKAANYSHAAR